MTVGHFVTVGLVGRSLVRESCGEYRPVTGEIATCEFFRDHETERITLLQGEKVDVPLEHVDDLLDELRAFARRAKRVVEGGLDGRGDRGLDLPLFGLVRDDVETIAVADRIDLSPTI